MIRKKSILTILFFVYFVSAYTQASYYLDVVKKDYPQVYQSIAESVYQQWPEAKDSNIRLIAMQAQAKVFLEVAEQNQPIDENAMTNSILKNSLKGQEEYNRQIVEDESIKNPFAFLRCDWYRVKSDYFSTRNGVKLPPTVRERETVPTKKTIAQVESKQTEVSENSYYTSSDKKESLWSSSYGVKLALGGASFSTSSKFKQVTELDSKLGFSAEIGVIRRFQRKSFFIQGELSVQMANYRFSDNKYYGSDESNTKKENYNDPTLGYIKAQLYTGINTKIDRNINLVAGVGPYVAYKFNLDGKFYYNYYWERIYGDGYYNGTIHDQIGLRPKVSDNSDIRNFDFGLSAMLGLEIDDLQFTVQPSMGLLDLNKYDLGMKTFSIQFTTAFFF